MPPLLFSAHSSFRNKPPLQKDAEPVSVAPGQSAHLHHEHTQAASTFLTHPHHPQKGKECQQEQCKSNENDNRFSMTSTTLTTDSVYAKNKLLMKSRRQRGREREKNEARILGKVILDTWRFILGYIAKYHWILFRGSFLLLFSCFPRMLSLIIN